MKIPPQAKPVFKGMIFDVYQWEQEMFDGSHQTFEMLKRPDTVQVIATAGDKVLVAWESQPHKHNFYTLMGGRCEEGEEPLHAAQRELFEESGLESKDWELFKAYEPIHKIEWTVYTYIARDCKKVAEPKLDAGEKIAVEEADFDKFISIVESDQFWGKEISTDILKMKLEDKLNEFREKIFSTGKY